MKCKLFATSLIAAVFLTGCSSSSGVLPAGPDTYTVTEQRSPFMGGGAEAEHTALTEANKYCEDHGRKFLPVSRDESGDHTNWGSNGYTVTFHCYLPSDPRMVKAQYGFTPELDTQNPKP